MEKCSFDHGFTNQNQIYFIKLKQLERFIIVNSYIHIRLYGDA